jgi:hypothetical protein
LGDFKSGFSENFCIIAGNFYHTTVSEEI